MILMNGLDGLGYPPGPPDDPCKYDPDWNGCMQQLSANRTTPGTNNTSGGSSWWEDILTSVTKGAVQGFTQDGKPPGPPMPGQPGYIPPQPPAPPWYTTPMGMGGIAAGALMLFLVLRK